MDWKTVRWKASSRPLHNTEVFRQGRPSHLWKLQNLLQKQKIESANLSILSMCPTTCVSFIIKWTCRKSVKSFKLATTQHQRILPRTSVWSLKIQKNSTATKHRRFTKWLIDSRIIWRSFQKHSYETQIAAAGCKLFLLNLCFVNLQFFCLVLVGNSDSLHSKATKSTNVSSNPNPFLSFIYIFSFMLFKEKTPWSREVGERWYKGSRTYSTSDV